ncbi:hypothetical protein C8R45DRAFT_572859 [Mycena sanguinolenta]|nr:hypothetical protein C8R45DRAFT_572859 [Mycena sanguinolenta]
MMPLESRIRCNFQVFLGLLQVLLGLHQISWTLCFQSKRCTVNEKSGSRLESNRRKTTTSRPTDARCQLGGSSTLLYSPLSLMRMGLTRFNRWKHVETAVATSAAATISAPFVTCLPCSPSCITETSGSVMAVRALLYFFHSPQLMVTCRLDVDW